MFVKGVVKGRLDSIHSRQLFRQGLAQSDKFTKTQMEERNDSPTEMQPKERRVLWVYKEFEEQCVAFPFCRPESLARISDANPKWPNRAAAPSQYFYNHVLSPPVNTLSHPLNRNIFRQRRGTFQAETDLSCSVCGIGTADFSMDSADGQEPPRKRARVEMLLDTQTNSPSPLPSLEKPITPPPQRRAKLQTGAASSPYQVSAEAPQVRPSTAIVSSPFRLTTIQDLPAALNVDTIALKDLLGDPLIAECWEFNFLHDLDFLMEAFDSDVRDMVNVHVVHGFWKHEDGTRLKMQASRYPNVTLHTAYMPEAFGTHHTKMMVLLRHDDLAQIIIHTANLIRKDWTNISQAVWTSPLLPLRALDASSLEESPPMGSGSRFKIDFLNYLRAYDQKRTICKSLIEKLIRYDFTEIRAALVASVPGRHKFDSKSKTKWGWQSLQHVLSSIPVQTAGSPEIILQISSIATLGQTNQWLDKTLFKSLAFSKPTRLPTPKYKIIFPTPDEVRKSLDGYGSGASIHTKITTPAQLKQLQYLRPILNHWAGDNGKQLDSDSATKIREAGRRRAAPHIKTYVRFCDTGKTQIDWALVTSANVSKQAWGEASNASGEVRICSYELGVLVWPELWGQGAKMVPTFKQDMPLACDQSTAYDKGVVVGFRMPYDLPLVPYSKEEEPWCASSTYNEPDWRGSTWAGF